MFDMSDAIFHLLFPGLHFLLRNVDPRRILLAKERVSLYIILKLALCAVLMVQRHFASTWMSCRANAYCLVTHP